MMFRPSFPHPFVLGRYHSSVFPDILASLARSNLHWTRHTASPTRNIPCNLLAAHRQRYKGRSSWEQLDRILYKHSYTLAETGTGYHTLLVSPTNQTMDFVSTHARRGELQQRLANLSDSCLPTRTYTHHILRHRLPLYLPLQSARFPTTMPVRVEHSSRPRFLRVIERVIMRSLETQHTLVYLVIDRCLSFLHVG